MTTKKVTLAELVDAVESMRGLQRSFFRRRGNDLLERAKRAEREVDEMIFRYRKPLLPVLPDEEEKQ